MEEGHDYCIIHPPAVVKPNVDIDTYDDHRMAMCFSLVACGGEGHKPCYINLSNLSTQNLGSGPLMPRRRPRRLWSPQ